MKLQLSRRSFEKYLNIKFHKNPSSGSRVVPCGQTEMAKPIVAFHNFLNSPKKLLFLPTLYLYTVLIVVVIRQKRRLFPCKAFSGCSYNREEVCLPRGTNWNFVYKTEVTLSFKLLNQFHEYVWIAYFNVKNSLFYPRNLYMRGFLMTLTRKSDRCTK